MQTANREGFANVDIELKPYIIDPKIEEVIGQSLSRLLGWYESGKTWVPILVNQNGQIQTTQNQPNLYDPSYGGVTVASTPTLIKSENVNRQKIIVTNNGSGIVFIGFDSNVTDVSGYPLGAGETLTLSETISAVYGITTTGVEDIRYIEL